MKLIKPLSSCSLTGGAGRQYVVAAVETICQFYRFARMALWLRQSMRYNLVFLFEGEGMRMKTHPQEPSWHLSLSFVHVLGALKAEVCIA